MKYSLNVNINSDEDFGYDSKWVRVKEDNVDNIWIFETREEAVKAFIECYKEIAYSITTSKKHLITEIRNKMVNFIPFLDLVLRKNETLELWLDNGNQDLYFTLSTYNETTKQIECSNDMYISVDDYDWEAIKEMKDFNE